MKATFSKSSQITASLPSGGFLDTIGGTRGIMNSRRQPVAVEKALPRPGEWVTVITLSYRCLGYFKDGIWRDVARNQPIENVVAWIPNEGGDR